MERCEGAHGYADRGGDCDDGNPAVHPEASDVCGDGVDNDCSGVVDDGADTLGWFEDQDGDGHGAGDEIRDCARPSPTATTESTDCDDANSAVYPGAPDEPYDGVDADCLGDDDFDVDGDGYRLGAGGDSVDCDDTDPTIHPTALDPWYDGVDSNCDGADDHDADGDGYRAEASGGDDCDDTDLEVNPGAIDRPDDVDDDCDGVLSVDADGDGHGWGGGGDDCDDTQAHVWFSCDTCTDMDRDGYWSGCDAYEGGEDCDESDAQVHPGAPDALEDGIDGDCDGVDAQVTGPAVFVSPTGSDEPGCGNPESPCRQAAIGAEVAERVGVPVFLAGGVYEGLTTSATLVGGFEDVTWLHAPGEQESWLEGEGSGVVSALALVSDEPVSASFLHLRVVGSPATARVLRALSPSVVLEGIEVDGAGAVEACRGMLLEVAAAEIRDSTVVGCAAAGENFGVEIVRGALQQDALAEIAGLTVRLDTVVSDNLVGLRVRGGGLSLMSSLIEVTGPEALGLLVDLPTSGGAQSNSPVRVVQSSIWVVGAGTAEEGTGVAARQLAQPLILESCNVRVEGFARAEAVSLVGTQGDVVIVSTWLEAQGTQGVVMALQGQLEALIEHATLQSATLQGISASETVSGEVKRTLWLGGGAGVGVETPLRVGESWFSGCIHAGCPTLESFDSCATEPCSGNWGNRTGDPLVQPGGMGLWEPAPGSPLLDVGPTGEELPSWDAAGRARVVRGAADVGALEQQSP